MFYSDHKPAHFHAIYREYEALIEVDTLSMFRCRDASSRWYWNGPRSIALLREDWRRARNGETLNEIEPLKAYGPFAYS